MTRREMVLGGLALGMLFGSVGATACTIRKIKQTVKVCEAVARETKDVNTQLSQLIVQP